MASFLEDHLTFNQNNESPDYFHIWSGVWAIACQLGKRVWLSQGYQDVFPNNYICLVGPSALVRKSAAKNVAFGLLEDADPPMIVLPQKCTTEFFINRMLTGVRAEEVDGRLRTFTVPAVVCADELSSLISQATKMSGIAELLNTCYTCPRVYDSGTMLRGEETIPDPCINLLACTTTTWLKKNMGKDILEEGFFGRFIWIFQSTRARKIPRPVVTPELVKIRQTLVGRLVRYQSISGEMFLTEQAGVVYDNWYNSLETSRNAIIDAFIGRIHEHALKTAMCISVGCGEFPNITDHHMGVAIDLVMVVLKYLPEVADSLDEDGETNVRILVVETIRKQGRRMENGYEYGHSDLVKYLWRKPGCTTPLLKDALAYLEQTGLIKSRRDKKKTIWVLLDQPKE